MDRADAIVVLGCRILENGRPSQAAQRRIDMAASAYREGVAPRVLATGGRRWDKHVEALVMRRAIIGAGVPEHAAMVELCSMTTCENAFFSAALLARLGVRRVVVVTCSWHMPRALAAFHDAGLDATPRPSPGLEGGIFAAPYHRLHEVVARQLDARAMARMQAMPRPLRVEGV